MDAFRFSPELFEVRTDVMAALHGLGATRYVETGPGRVLTGLVRKSLDGVEAEAPLAMEAANA